MNAYEKSTGRHTMAPENPSSSVNGRVLPQNNSEYPYVRLRMYQKDFWMSSTPNRTSDTAIQSSVTRTLNMEQESSPKKVNMGIPVVSYNNNGKSRNYILQPVARPVEQKYGISQATRTSYNIQGPPEILKNSQTCIQRVHNNSQQISNRDSQLNTQLRLNQDSSTRLKNNNQDSTMQNTDSESCGTSQQSLLKLVSKPEQQNLLNSKQSSSVIQEHKNISLVHQQSQEHQETNPNTKFQQFYTDIQSQQSSVQQLPNQQENSNLNQQKLQISSQLQQTSTSSQTDDENLSTEQSNSQPEKQNASREQHQQTSPQPENQHSSGQQSNAPQIPTAMPQYQQPYHPQHARVLPLSHGLFYPTQPQYIPHYYFSPYYPQTVYQPPWSYQQVLQPIQFPQQSYQPHETKWNIPQNVAIPTANSNGLQRVESIYPVSLRTSGNIQSHITSHPTVPRSNQIQLCLESPKVINLQPSMLNQISLTIGITDRDCPNSLSSSNTEETHQGNVPVVNNSNKSIAAIQTEETPTCSKYLQSKLILPKSTNASSSTMNSLSTQILIQNKNSTTESSLSQLHMDNEPYVELQPVGKVLYNKHDKNNIKYRSHKMEPITENVTSHSILSPVLWNSSALTHPLRPGQSKTKGKKECAFQNENSPNKKRQKKKKT